ncbi:murein hydrolase activator EnvC family protein [Abyssalbus ytuae]|uniref:Peptidoglycan DD-metalloendopeptidase family protein n=1 Tax=Abyssalbus ytuae TaxID=2926907 RepID=A0A9E6ZNX6_9FLAO|nr:peptidoglycan DD-metalloendopeptidase family protein [Abyssalbus ytuae]UOB16023.1 peptidoglycan DD-metalloendopeptidase family protein [Abyssalbus ytuae]
MMRIKAVYGFFFGVLLFFSVCPVTLAQSSEQKELEAKRERLQEEIKQINSLLSQKRKEKTNILTELEDIDQKIRVRKELIKLTHRQANLIIKQINDNIKRIDNLRTDLKLLKEDYADMIRKSYKNNSHQSRLMFLLSSENFFQAYKRLQYIKQYTNYRKEQGLEIQEKTKELQQLNKDLVIQQKEKETLISDNKLAQKELEEELKTQRELITSIKAKESEYAAQIKKKQRESDAIDKQIDRLIEEAIAKSNKSSGGNTKSTNFALTAEAKLLDAGFKSNKGKLPWPVEKGVVIMGYGTQPHPVVKSVNIKSNGVRIATEEGSKARSVFEGKVLAVQIIKGGNKVVLVQHGNYISVYNNLSKVFVKEGDDVVTKQEIGEVFTSKINNETILKFMIYENNRTSNPANWIFQM